MRDSERAARERLIRLGGEPLADELSAVFVEEMTHRLAAARIAVGAGDAAALVAVAHAMKSSSGQLGALDLAEACERMELAGEAGDVGRAASGLMEVEFEYATFAGWLRECSTKAHFANQPSREAAWAKRGTRSPLAAIIEDNFDNRLLLNAILGEDFAVAEYAGGREALEGMQKSVPDVVLLDVSLPAMDGLEVLAQMRRHPTLRRVPVVAVTAHAMAGDRERYLAAGFDAYIPKPIVDEEALMDTVRLLLERRSASEQGM